MRKIFLMISIIFMISSINFSEIHSNKFKYNISSNNVSKKTVMYVYDGIKYVSLNDTLELLNSLNKDNVLNLIKYNNGLKLMSENVIINFDMVNNKIFGQVEFNYGFYPNESILFDKKVKKNEHNYEEINLNLNKFGVNLIKKQGELYIPYELLSLLVLGRSVYIKDDLNGTLIVDQGYLHKNFEINRELIDLTIVQKKYIFNLLSLYLDYIYPYNSDNLSYIKDYINNNLEYMNNDEYYDSIAKLLGLNNDYHTNPYYFSETKVFTPAFVNLLNNAYEVNESNVLFFNLMNENIYIKIPHFNFNNLSELIYSKLSNDYEKTNNIILDLRNNSGGYFIEYRNLLKIFKRDLYEYYIYDYDSTNINNYNIVNNEKLIDFNNLIVLINKNTHSSASLFALAVKNNDIGTIVGEESIGYHTDNRYIYLCDNSIIRMSTGGILVNKNGTDIYGVKPDIEINDINTNIDNILNAALNYLEGK